ncbi:MAG: ABC transporter ATP-binding protein, partial [Saprospiraceae bacterium]|nr:ABC transporter ATP-binding protein [Saprospiraceae bacterium]
MLDKEESRTKLSRQNLREALKIFEFLRPYRWQFITGLVLLFLSSTVFMIFPYSVGLMLDVAQGKETAYDLNLSKIGLGLLVVLVFQGVVSYSRVQLFAQISERGTADIRNALYQRIIS